MTGLSATIIKPMLASPIDVIPAGSDHVIEPKYDGWRATAYITEDGVILRTRTGNLIDQVPYINAALRCLPAGTVIDGELVDLDGETQFNRVAKILQRKNHHTPVAGSPELTFVAFDALEVAGECIAHKPLSVRRGFLEIMFQHESITQFSYLRLTTQEPATDEAADRIIAAGFEGVVVKRLSGPYEFGVRNGGWSKLKPDAEVEAVCTGTYPAEPGSQYAGRAVGGILFRVEHEDGTVYEGKAAGRMNNALRSELHDDPDQFIGLVVEIGHWGILDGGALRHPSFRRFRHPSDKPAPTTGGSIVFPAGSKNLSLGQRAVREASTKPAVKRMRNYKAMKPEKLLRVIAELEAGGPNEATSKASDDISVDLAEARKAAAAL